MTLMRRGLPAVYFALSLLSPGAGAWDLFENPPVSLSGFGTFGLVHNSTGAAGFRRDFTQPHGVAGGWGAMIDSRIGLQLNAAFTPDFETVVQAVSRYNHDGNFTPELTWAFAGWSPTPDLKLRAGRLGWDVYMLADSRDVGYSYNRVRPPVEYFGLLFLTHIDGGDAVYQRQLPGGLLSAKLYGGFIDEITPSEAGPNFHLSGSSVVGLNLDYRSGDWAFRAGYTHARIDNEYPTLRPLIGALRATGLPSAADIAADLSFKGKGIQIASAGVAWERGPWQAQLMYDHLWSEILSAPTTNSGHLLVAYRRGNWKPYVGVSGTAAEGGRRLTGLPLPNPLDAAVAAALKLAQDTQYSLSAGVRYDFMSNADLKLQVDRIHVFDHETALWRDVKPAWDGDATLFSIALDFVF